MKCLISFDGLGSEELEILCQWLPSVKSFIESGDFHALDNCFLTQPQPIWAEILTGTPWYENGCSAYSRPSSSLNKLAVVSEKDLCTRAKLLETKNGGHVASINVPIVKQSPQRLWLSDGSLPMNKQVSPSSLAKEEPFKSYKSRPFMDLGEASGSPAESARTSITVEKKRVECALNILQNFRCERFILRLTIFDHLSHLFGTSYLQTKNLVIYDELLKLFAYLDSAINEVLSAFNGEALLLSGYSHQPCRSSLNLNSILEEGGLLQITHQFDELKKQRINAANAVLGYEPASPLMSSYEGQIDERATVAASSSYGSVYINRSELFENGSVTPASYEEKRIAVRQLLQKALAPMFASVLHLQEAPRESMKIPVPIPEFILNIDGVEFHNIRKANLQDYDVPRTTHSSSGFLVAPKGRLSKGESIKLTEITELFA